MDLNTVRAVKRPATPDSITAWAAGDAWLAGGTWLFSEPQVGLETLIDLQGFGWPNLTLSAAGLEIAATCPIAMLGKVAAPPEWRAAPLIRDCSQALLMSFKVAGVATVGGNICLSLPAGAMTSLAVALEAVYTLWPRDGGARRIPAADFVTGNHANLLRPGELLRSVFIPAAALSKAFAFRRASLTQLGRSAALLIGTRTPGSDDLLLTITASTPRPVQLPFPQSPSPDELQRAIAERIAPEGWFDDVNGLPAYRRHVTRRFAEEIRAELAAAGGAP